MLWCPWPWGAELRAVLALWLSHVWTLVGLPLEGRDIDLGACPVKVLLMVPAPATRLHWQPAPCHWFCSCDVKSPREDRPRRVAVSIKFHPLEALGSTCWLLLLVRALLCICLLCPLVQKASLSPRHFLSSLV